MRGWNFDPATPPGAVGSSLPAAVETGRGKVTITLTHDDAGWVGGRVNTRGLLEFTRGRAHFDVSVPGVAGAWLAVWTMGDPWPTAGEFDLLETGMPNAYEGYTTVHDSDGPDRLATVPATDGNYSVRRDGSTVKFYKGDHLLAKCDDPSSAPHWLCFDLMAWAASPPTQPAKASIQNVSVSPLG